MTTNFKPQKTSNRMNKMPEVIQVSPTYSHHKKVIRSHGVIDPTSLTSAYQYKMYVDDTS